MPTYDYKCKTCNLVFEHFQAMKDDSLKECLCGKKGEVTRMISGGTGIIFKGSGFYVNDYKKGAKPESGTSTEKPATAPASTTTAPSTSSTTSTPSEKA